MKVFLFGSYLYNPQMANDVDIAIVTQRLHGGSIIGRLIPILLKPFFYTFYKKRIDMAIYSESYLNSRILMNGNHLNKEILSGKLLLKI